MPGTYLNGPDLKKERPTATLAAQLAPEQAGFETDLQKRFAFNSPTNGMEYWEQQRPLLTINDISSGSLAIQAGAFCPYSGIAIANGTGPFAVDVYGGAEGQIFNIFNARGIYCQLTVNGIAYTGYGSQVFLEGNWRTYYTPPTSDPLNFKVQTTINAGDTYTLIPGTGSIYTGYVELNYNDGYGSCASLLELNYNGCVGQNFVIVQDILGFLSLSDIPLYLCVLKVGNNIVIKNNTVGNVPICAYVRLSIIS